ncbi:MAG TPA: GAF domain-containing protein [Methylomirabilota bacterium]|nr:GAF domain-containing protein [Methylomirabilota bacterium]
MQPDPRLVEHRADLLQRLRLAASQVSPDNFYDLLDPLMEGVLQRGFSTACAHEGSVWLLDAEGENLVPAYNSGPQAAEFVGRFRQPVNRGLIGMVLASEQPFVENEVFKNARQDKGLDQLLRVQTCSLIAVPFYLMKSCRGVISCVQLKRADAPGSVPEGFAPEHLASVQCAAGILSRLLEYRLLSNAIGLD